MYVPMIQLVQSCQHVSNPSIKMIDKEQIEKDAFDFKPTDQETVSMSGYVST